METQKSQFQWTATRIHSLRLRLGWSRSDLARRLDCSLETVNAWELSQMKPNPDHLPMLEFIEKQAEHISLEVHVCPIAESQLEKTHLSQIPLDELI